MKNRVPFFKVLPHHKINDTFHSSIVGDENISLSFLDTKHSWSSLSWLRKALNFNACHYNTNMNLLCLDIDECLLGYDDCAEGCINTPGNYNCTCDEGYVVAADGHTCDGRGKLVLSSAGLPRWKWHLDTFFHCLRQSFGENFVKMMVYSIEFMYSYFLQRALQLIKAT